MSTETEDKSFLENPAHSHITGLDVFDDEGNLVIANKSLVGPMPPRECAAFFVKMVQKKALAGKIVLISGAPSSGKSALSVAIFRELAASEIPCRAMDAKDVFKVNYLREREPTALFRTNLRKCVLLLKYNPFNMTLHEYDNSISAIKEDEVQEKGAEGFDHDIPVANEKIVDFLKGNPATVSLPGVLFIRGLKWSKYEAGQYFNFLGTLRRALDGDGEPVNEQVQQRLTPTIVVIVDMDDIDGISIIMREGVFMAAGTPPACIFYCFLTSPYTLKEAEETLKLRAQAEGVKIGTHAFRYLQRIVYGKSGRNLKEAHQVLQEAVKIAKKGKNKCTEDGSRQVLITMSHIDKVAEVLHSTKVVKPDYEVAIPTV